ncbi:MAG: SUMF1/EgtB/PvdO family nonheme iron enzyme [Chloroflexi bacterium]|nr:SUMF1/EgtB/PvdO family nonheme iron enzyme [Chloroflexota bacterium]
MRLFISYARLDKPYCIQISNLLTAHEVWFDQRFYVGDRWWDEILRRLEWCEGFIYLLSPASVASTYCQQEFDLAVQLQRNVFPLLIHDQTSVPESVLQYQYVDLSNGLTPETTAHILNSITNVERNSRSQQMQLDSMPRSQVELPVFNSASVISVAAAAMEKGQFDQAVFLFKQAKAKGFTSRFINIDKLLKEAERQLEDQAKKLQRDIDYRQITSLIRVKTTRDMGCEALGEFLKEYPGYDPESMMQACAGVTPAVHNSMPTIASEAVGARIDTHAASQIVSPRAPTAPKSSMSQVLAPPTAPTTLPGTNGTVTTGTITIAPVVAPSTPTGFTLPLLDFVSIPAGNVHFEDVDSSGIRSQLMASVPAFHITRFPVTNKQFQAFLEDPDGYASPRWWGFSAEAALWRAERPNPQAGKFEGDDRPRDTVAWFDAMAFCNWLSARMQEDLCLPTSEQWFRAARGDSQRIYPWGDTFDPDYCNVKECELKMTTPVTRYTKGVSLFGVWDMAGNIWEWTVSAKIGPAGANGNGNGSGSEAAHFDVSGYAPRAVHGGAYHSEAERARIPFRYYLNPRISHNSIGFRIVKRGK